MVASRADSIEVDGEDQQMEVVAFLGLDAGKVYRAVITLWVDDDQMPAMALGCGSFTSIQNLHNIQWTPSNPTTLETSQSVLISTVDSL